MSRVSKEKLEQTITSLFPIPEKSNDSRLAAKAPSDSTKQTTVNSTANAQQTGRFYSFQRSLFDLELFIQPFKRELVAELRGCVLISV